MNEATHAAGRNAAIDILRGLAIILVVIGHANRGRMEAMGSAAPRACWWADFTIYTTHMPAFFLLAGFFAFKTISRDGTGGFLKSRWWAVIYPYILWSLILWTSKYLGGALINKPLPVQRILQIAYAPISIYWFLYALAVLQMIAIALHARGLIFAAAALVALALIPPDALIPIVEETLAHAPFFALGLVLAQFGRPVLPPALRRWPVLAAIALAFAGGCALALRLGASASVSFVMLPVDLLGVMTLAGIAQRFVGPAGQSSSVSRHLALLGRLSLPIYLLHIFTLSMVPRLLHVIDLQSMPVYYVLSLAVGIYGPLAFYFAANRVGAAGWLGLTGRKPLGQRHPAASGSADLPRPQAR